MEKENFKKLMKSVHQMGEIMKGKKLPGMRVTYRAKPLDAKHGSLKHKVVIYWSEQDKSYIAEVPELPGCMADGPSYEKALKSVLRCMREWLEVAKDEGRLLTSRPIGMRSKSARYKEPESLLEVRRWKRKASREIEKYGWEEARKRATIRTKSIRERLEKSRSEFMR